MAVVLQRLPNRHNHKIILANVPQTSGHDSYTLYLYNEDGQITDGLNIYYEISLDYDDVKHPKSPDTGYVNKFFYIDENYSISLFYFDYFYYGEAELYKFLRREQWQITQKGKFVRYYNMENGYYKNNEEEGYVKHHRRDGNWIEKKPNAYVNEYTYLEAKYKDGQPIKTSFFYKLNYVINDLPKKDYATSEINFPKWESATKGKLLYTEKYKNSEIIAQNFVN